jgi:ABC-type nitrate/sulfonate/bicarbonate transport system substrate-binding protein
MMKRLVRHGSVLLVLSLLLAACGGEPGTAPQTNQPQTSQTQPQAPAKTLKPLKFAIGNLANSTFMQVFEYYDNQHQILKKTAEEFGYDLKVEWKTFPVAPPMLAAMKAGEVQCGAAATFPVIGQISQGSNIVPLSLNLGAYEFILLVDKESPIRNFEDLKGKKVGVAVGTAHQGVLETFLLSEFGKTSKELGIELVNQPVPVPFLPKGVDALQTFVPAGLPAIAEGKLGMLVNMYGITGDHYNGPLGKGAGHRIPSVKNSPFNPEGYAALRNFYLCPEEFIQQHPDVAKAFVIAQQKVIKWANGQSTKQLGDLYPADYWKAMPRELFEQRSLANDLLYKHRDWVWITDAEVNIVVEESKIMARIGAIKEPLTREQVIAFFKKGAAITKAAYEATGKYPAASDFTKTGVYDFRGKPIWDL